MSILSTIPVRLISPCLEGQGAYGAQAKVNVNLDVTTN